MVRRYIHIAGLLLCAWSIYSQCQNETLLPIIAGGILLGSFLMRLGSMDKQFKLFEQIPLYAIIISSLILGYFLRSAFPLPEEAISPYPQLTATAQSATIIASIFLWLKPATNSNIYLMTLMAWLTAALSMNVPLSDQLYLKFSLFFLLSVMVIILNTFHRPENKIFIFKYYLDFICYSLILMLVTIVLFLGISRSVAYLDNTFINTMRDYFLPPYYSNFLNIDSKLTLVNPGYSAFDKRPVLEVSFPNVNNVYLKTQVFKDYNNGVWEEMKDPALVPIPKQLEKEDTKISLTMFVPFKNILPSPSGVTAIQGPGRYQKDENQIIYGENERQTRVLTFSAKPTTIPVQMTNAMIEEYTQIPENITHKLKELSSAIVGDTTNRYQKTQLIRDFFKNGFQYSLNVNFRANNQGLISMIEEKRPAYCTYFATAMSLLLRAQGVPSRVVTGFSFNEVTDKRENRFLARVRDAHAWVEVLLTRNDLSTGQKTMGWYSFDPTPPSENSLNFQGNTGFHLYKFVEKFRLSLLRFIAYLQNIDKEKAKLYLLYVLLISIALINSKAIFRGLKHLLIKEKVKIIIIQPPVRLQLIYKRYEQYLHNEFKEIRRSTETDHDVVDRLKQRSEIPRESIAKVESFLKHYHAARFGEKKDENLEEMLR